MRTLHFIFFLIISWSVNSQDAPFEIADIPDWIVPLALEETPEVNKYDVINGNYYTLIDYQTNTDLLTDFFHYGVHIVSEAGVTAMSELAIVFDSSYQQVDFHYFRIQRSGEILDMTDQIKFELLRYEDDLDQSMYYGLVKAHAILEDIRKGDIIEYAYSNIGDNPIFKGKVFRHYPLQDINTIGLLHIRVIGDHTIPLYHKCHDCVGDKLHINSKGKYQEISIKQTNVEAVEYETTEPSWYIPYSSLTISSFDNWSDVNQWASSVFELDDKRDELQRELIAKHITPEMSMVEKITTLLDYVQNDIRYMAVESGIGSIKPYHPEDVLDKRFGDCKDKSLLLVELLHKVGLDHAYPALVSTVYHQAVAEFIPSGQIFDHCIVHLLLDGQEYWVDPSLAYQGGDFRMRTPFPYQKALVIKDANDDLNDMVVASTTFLEVKEILEIPNYTEPASLTVSQSLQGDEADYYRQFLEYYSSKEVAEHLQTSYNYLFHNIEANQKLKIDDDKSANVMTVLEDYDIAELWETQEEKGVAYYKFQYEPVKLYNYINSLSCESKEHPVSIPYPSKYKQITEIRLPDHWALDDTIQEVDNVAFSYTKTSRLSKKNTLLTLTYEYESKKSFIEAQDYKKVCKEMNEAVNDLPLVLYIPKPK